MSEYYTAIENKHGAIPVIEGDETYLESALLNIILNAIEAMENGGKLTISTAQITSPAKSAVVEINISDTGGGISHPKIEIEILKIIKPLLD
ncbi:MAG: hypothetical protein HZA06_03410 [Nitrospirae bacterium]|nr:hypothetical protein [Nitrospirota bacterium]